MSDKVAEIRKELRMDDAAVFVSQLWTKFNNQRQNKLADWDEVRRYVFATDTSQTSNSSLPWRNTTTLPKLTQIKDTLFANYMSSLFPNDKWLKWQAYDQESANKEKARNITSYMSNKVRQGRTRTVVGKLVDDWIMYGMCFAQPEYVSRINENVPNNPVKDFIGPKLNRISPENIVFNPLATSFDDTFKIVRSVKTTGELMKMAKDQPDMAFWKEAIEQRQKIKKLMSGYSHEDFNKAMGYQVDGFGDLNEYFMSDYIEVLEFYGDYHDHNTDELRTNVVITVVDRNMVVREEPINTYSGRPNIRAVGWRDRPDNLWSMGPLDNLVGLQYRIDHLENLKADAMDLAIWPMLVIQGDVEPFQWTPGGELHLDADGNVAELGKNAQAIITTDSEIEFLESKMELFAGAPREAAGIRTPGEKTAFEVQQLQNAAGRLFQEKITKFEVEFLEPVLNDMLEVAHRNFDSVDVIAVMDNDLGVEQFKEITKEDITANGILRPVGARHFAQKAQELQNLIGVFNTPIGQMVAPHTSSKALTEYLNDAMDIRGYNIFRENVAIIEQQETQGLLNQAQEDLEVQSASESEGAIGL